MKPIPEDLNKAFESKVRLGIMSVLMANESVDFVTMKSLLELTDGNLLPLPLPNLLTLLHLPSPSLLLVLFLRLHLLKLLPFHQNLV